MTLRTTAVIAGVLGLLMLIAGLIANATRADREVMTQATLDTPVVVLGPDVLALPGIERIAVNGEGGLAANTARPVDADAWLKNFSATYVLGYDTWDALSTRTADRVVAEIPSESASPSPEATDEAAATATPTPEPSAEPEPVDYGSTDVWRDTWSGEDRVAITGSRLSAGESLVIYAVSGENLSSIEFFAERNVNDGWISPLIWIGAALAIVGAFAFVSGIVDVRPLQARVEGWRRGRGKSAPDAPKPGSRRERRLAGSTLPEVSLDEPRDEALEAALQEQRDKAAADAAPTQSDVVEQDEVEPVEDAADESGDNEEGGQK